MLSFANRAQALNPRRLRRALTSAGASLVPVIATTACAGILVAGLTLTGLGLKVAGLIVSLAGSNATGVILLSAVAVSVLGLSVPVTASYILSAVTIAPALIQVGVNELAAHMFIFYYAVLSEVSPPTALSPMAAAAITGGNPFKTTMMAWKYTITAFLLPFIFTVLPEGKALLLHWEGISVISGVWTIVSAFIGIGLLASGCSGWLTRRSTALERAITILAALGFVLPYHIGSLAGAVLTGIVLVLQRRAPRGSDRRHSRDRSCACGSELQRRATAVIRRCAAFCERSHTGQYAAPPKKTARLG